MIDTRGSCPACMRTFDRLDAGRLMPNHYAAAGVCPCSAKKIARFDSMRRAVFAVEPIAMAGEIQGGVRDRNGQLLAVGDRVHDIDIDQDGRVTAIDGVRKHVSVTTDSGIHTEASADSFIKMDTGMDAVTMAYTGDPDALAHINEGDRVRAVQGGRELWSGTVVRCVRGTDNSGLRPRSVTDSIVVRTADGGTEAVDTYSMYIYKTKVEKV